MRCGSDRRDGPGKCRKRHLQEADCRPAIVEWNSDKRYLGELAMSGLPVIPTMFVEPGGAPPELSGTVVVKPAVSAGGRDSGRFSPSSHAAAVELIRDIGASGRTAMV